MKQASLIAVISMAVLIFVDIISVLFGYGHLYGVFILFFLLKLAAKCGVGYFFLTLYKKQG